MLSELWLPEASPILLIIISWVWLVNRTCYGSPMSKVTKSGTSIASVTHGIMGILVALTLTPTASAQGCGVGVDLVRFRRLVSNANVLSARAEELYSSGTDEHPSVSGDLYNKRPRRLFLRRIHRDPCTDN
jgi:hypothetical protein